MNKYEKAFKNVLIKRGSIKSYKAIMELVERATPPTVDDVCGALSEYFDEKVIYIDNQGFCFEESMLAIVIGGFECNTYYVIIQDNIGLPPLILAMIGQFYDNLWSDEK